MLVTAPPSSPVAVGTTLIYYVSTLALVSLVFGAYTVIMFLSSRMLRKRGLKNATNRNLFLITLFSYLLSTAFWIYTFIQTAARLTTFVANPQSPSSSIPATHFFVTFNAIILLNFAISDALVVWRARLICAPEHRKYMLLPAFFVLITFLCVVTLIGMRIGGLFNGSLAKRYHFILAINVLQIAVIDLSLISNLCTTTVFAVTAWRHRETVRKGFKRTTTNGNRILQLLLESGLIYSGMALVTLATSFIRLPYNTLGDIMTPVSILCAGAYTPTILLLVHSKRSLSEPTFLGSLDLESSSDAPWASDLPPIFVDPTLVAPQQQHWLAEPKPMLVLPTPRMSSESMVSDTSTTLSPDESRHRHKVSDAGTLV
ncbi:hypothetical protein HMN09_00756000 [Mycena chlorophos]|uniref:Uncharacterized protein n=1 Tax=Mycena chlorophos TaxID=658473 RepID=A0A8H6W512_MYCCL|nr:hypothetical protein HMN09_00756000 [Mycena chlorophos]